MNRHFRCIRALLIVLVCASSAWADPPEIRAGSELDFRPYCFTDPNGRPTGFGVELLQAVADKATLRLSLVAGEWDKVWNELISGEIDVLPVVARTPGREGLVEFSLPHTETFDAFFVRTGAPPITDLAQAVGKEIVVLRSDAAHHQLVERNFNGKIVPVESIAEGLRLIVAGEHDALLCSRLIGVMERDQAGISGVSDGPVIPDYKRVFSFAVHKGNTGLVERLNQGLRLVKADGTYDRLYQKWLGIQIPSPFTWWDYFWRVIAVAGTVILIAVTMLVGRKVLELDSQVPAPAEAQPHASFSVALRYAIAPLSVVLAFMVHRGLSSWLGPGLPPFLLFYLPIIGVALIAGLGPGLTSVALAGVVISVWIIKPVGEWAIASASEYVALGFFLLNGLFICTVVYLYRVTRIKAAAYAVGAAVQEREERFRLFMDNSPTVAWIKDEEGRYVYLSGGFEERFGVQMIEWRGKTDAEIWPPEIGAQFRRTDLAALASERAIQVTEEAINPDGSSCYWLSTKFPFRDAAGCRYVAGIGLDITENKEAEKALKRHSAALSAINRVLELGLGRQTEEEMCQACLKVVEEATGSAISFICEIGADGLLHNLSISNPGWDACNMYDEGGHRRPAGSFHVRGIYGHAFSAGASLIVNDPPSHPASLGLPPGHPSLTSFLGVPLVREGKTVGMVAVGNRDGGYQIEERQILEAIAPAIVEALYRKRAEQALRDSEERYRTLFDSMTEGFALHEIVTDSQGQPVDYRFLDVNPAFQRLTGLKRKDVIGKCVLKVMPGIEGYWIESYGRVALTGEPVHFENFAANLNQWFEVYAYRPAHRQFAVVFSDITARKQAEEALASAHRKTQSIIDNTPDIIYALDLEERFILANAALAALFHTTPKQMIGKRRHELMPRKDAEWHESNDRKVIEGGRMLEFEEYSRLEDRSITWLTKKFPLRDSQGKIYAVGGISANISDRKRYEDQLQRLNETLEIKVMERTADLHAANQALEERANQLRRLAGELTTAEQRERRSIAKLLHDGLQQYLVAAKMRQDILIGELGGHEGRQTAREVEGLLTESIKVSRSLATELCPPVLDGGILAGFEWLTRFMASKHGLDVDLIVETGAPILPEDVKIFLFESVRELLLNVVKHSQVRSAKVHLREEGTKLLVTVSDSGNGFDPSTLEGRDIAGGFGLFSIRERIGLIGGAIDIDAAPGKGARFQLSVPFEKPASADTAPPPFAPARKAPAGATERIRILLADDHKVVREGLARILGAESDLEIVGQAEDGNAAVELTDALRPSVVLMDINMPDMDGVTATRILARKHPDVHVIGLSFYSAEERADEMLQAGARKYVSKTAPAEELKDAIRSCLSVDKHAHPSPSADRPKFPVVSITPVGRMPS